MHKYGVSIYWSDEDKVYIAEVPDLPGCMTHGDTPTSALTNANDAIQLWLDTAKEFGDPIPKPRGRQSVLGSTEFRSKSQGRAGRLISKRRSNPRITLSVERTCARMNPKAH